MAPSGVSSEESDGEPVGDAAGGAAGVAGVEGVPAVPPGNI